MTPCQDAPPSGACPAPAPDALAGLALAYLALPTLIFLATWFEWPVALAMLALAGLGLQRALAGLPLRPLLARLRRPTPIGLLIAGTAFGWSLLGGAGHHVHANADWLIRDAVLRDLVVSHWPVHYPYLGMTDLILRAPIAYYLPAALMGGLTGLASADQWLWAWTALGLALFLALLPWPRRLLPAAGLMAMVVLFSGMDIVGWWLRQGGLPAPGQHIEWWADLFQYSSNSTLLFWVPNHGLPGWIAIALFFRHGGHPGFGRFAPALFMSLPLWSPFAAIGMLPFYALLGWRLRHERDVFTVRNLGPAIAVLALVGRYLTLGLERVPAGMAMQGEPSSLLFVADLVLFVTLEFLPLGLLLAGQGSRSGWAAAMLMLLLLPLTRVGQANDLVMRAGIPAQMLLCLLAMQRLQSAPLRSARSVALMVLLLIGAVTPLQEITRALTAPAWKPRLQDDLLSAAQGSPPAHYMALLNQPGLAALMRKPPPLEAKGGSAAAAR